MTLRGAFQYLALLSMVGFIVLWVMAVWGLVAVLNVEKVLSACAILFGLGLGGLTCATARERGKYRGLMLSGIAVGLVAAAGWIVCMYGYASLDAFTRASITVLTAMTGWFCLMTYLAALAGATLKRSWVRWSRTIAMAGATLFVFHVVVSVSRFVNLQAAGVSYLTMRNFQETAYEVGGVLGMVAVFGLALIAVVSALPRIEHREVPLDQRRRLQLTCPRCGRRQAMVSDGDRCARCRLRIKVVPT